MKYCSYCKRYVWGDTTCADCGKEFNLCLDCGVELRPPEHKYCSLCASSKEHIGDLGYEEVDR